MPLLLFILHALVTYPFRHFSSFTAHLQILTIFKHNEISKPGSITVGMLRSSSRMEIKYVGVCLKHDVLHKSEFLIHPPPLQRV